MISSTRVVASAVLCLLTAASVQADPIMLTFENVGDQQPILDFYNGGAGGNYGISFDAGSRGLVDSDDGGNGNIANEPSSSTVLYYPIGSRSVMNVAGGFQSGLTLFYSAAVLGGGAVFVYDGPNGTGTRMAEVSLPFDATPSGGCGGGDPLGEYSCWALVSVNFAGTAKSAVFSGQGSFIVFDNVTVNPGVVPEPASFSLLALGLAGLGVRRWHQRKA
jgi:hypothetical protein